MAIPTTDLEVANLALDRIGEGNISSLSMPNTDANARKVIRVIDLTRQELLRSHRWNFAIKRTVLEPTWIAATAITDVGGEYQITKSAHGYATGDRVTVNFSTNYPYIAGTWVITVLSSSTFTLDNSQFSGSGTVDVEFATAALYRFDFLIPKPADCLRALEDDFQAETTFTAWQIEGQNILTSERHLEWKYLTDVTDVADMPPDFISAWVLALAIKLRESIQGAGADTRALKQEFTQLVAPLARRVDATEDQNRTRNRALPNQSLWVAARRGSGLGSGPWYTRYDGPYWG